ncbi:DUF2461 domain-containing protein [Maribellus sp. CM-23]|uniref:DUF2461 domain-containing protein n=1 Tax=Maribellus sp. CM-23 TaxID=2781026 RepID=UPI001F29D87A|nr:DUF2461 domain-containing protein [Maribellus sp. CM-23]MCE4566693.1 DUF2461 domain-containing protein [Maribellus sp. CM-23]
MDSVLKFLNELAANNNREWFQSNKKWYEESREKVLFLTDVLINEIGQFDREVKGLQPKDCMFRIFRDVRFSHDKRPYKTNFGSFICKGGRKSMNPGYYFHIEPTGCFMAGGIYMPPAEPLRIIRTYLADHAEEFLEITEVPDFKKEFPELYNDQLKTAPKGFPKDHQYIDLLKYKSFIYSKDMAPSLVSNEKYVETMVDGFSTLYPLNRFLYEALSQ